MDEAVRALRRDRAVPEQIGRKRPLGRIDQQSRRQYLDAGKNERCPPVAPTPAGDPPVGRPPEIPLPPMVVGARDRHETPNSLHPRVIPPPGKPPDPPRGAAAPRSDERRVGNKGGVTG